MQPIGKLTFYCPHCREKLSCLDGTLVKMHGRLECASFACTTTVLVPAKLGQPGVLVDPWVQLKDGARIELECPNCACRHSFTTSYNDELAEILMEDGEGNVFKVVFNTIYGKNSTFVLDVKARELVHAFGDAKDSVFGALVDTDRNFFGE